MSLEKSKNWQTKNLGEVCEIVNGGTPKTNIRTYWGGNILWITPKDMGKLDSFYVTDTERKISEKGLKNSSAKIIPASSIILSTRAPIGHLAINKKEITTNQGCKGLIPKKDLNVNFLFYFLKMSVALLNSLGSGTTFKELSSSKLKEVEIKLPSHSEQQRIVAIMDKAFSAIDKAKENVEKNIQNVQNIFDSYLENIVSNLYVNYELVKLSDLATDITDGDHMPPPKSQNGIPFITISNIDKKTNKIDFSNTFTVSKEYFEKLKSNRKPQKNDVLYTVTGSFGIPVVVDFNLDFCFQRHIGLIRPTTQTSPKWLYYLILSPQMLKQANDSATGTAQKTVSLRALRSFVVPRVPLSEQQLVISKLDSISAVTKKLESIYQKKLTLLEELKKSILHKAFSGELS